MESDLRPLTLGEILDRTAQLYRNNFLLFAGISAVYAAVVLALGLLQIGINAALHTGSQVTGAALVVAEVIGIFLFLFYGVVMAAVSRAVAWVHLGQPATIRSAYLGTLPRLGRYLWLMTMAFFIVFAPLTLLYGGFMAVFTHYVKGFGTDPAAQQASMSNPNTLMIVGVASLLFFVLMLPVSVYTILMGLRYSLSVPACVVEDLKARAAIRRSIALAKGAWGRIFLLALLIGVLKLGLVFVTQIFVFVAAFKHPGQMPGPGIQVLSQVIGFFTNTFLGPIFAMGVTLFYYDQRVRKEGFDIEWMMQAAGMTPPAPAAGEAADAPPAEAAAPLEPALNTEPPQPENLHE